MNVGNIVKVKLLEEIKSTLDDNNSLDKMPFMPEMVKFCGKKFRIKKLANFVYKNKKGIRAINNAILLDNIYCDGSSHNGCVKSCSIFWRKEWLTHCADENYEHFNHNVSYNTNLVEFKTIINDSYYCQSSQLQYFSKALNIFVKSKYLFKEFFAGNKPVILIIINVFYHLELKNLHIINYSLCWIIKGNKVTTPSESLNLEKGDLVEIRSKEEIIRTLDKTGKNRGMLFSQEMHSFCGQKFRVRSKLNRMITEDTGKMVEIKNTVLLEGLTCNGNC